MTLQIGNNDIGPIYFGNNEISEIYKGSQLLYVSYSNAPQYIFRDIDSNGKITLATGNLESSSSIKKVKADGLKYAFYKCTGITGSVDFPNLEVVFNSELTYSFSECSITSATFSNLQIINDNGLEYTFYNCPNLANVSFNSLNIIKNYGLRYTFQKCNKLNSISFPALNTESFGTSKVPFVYMFDSDTASVSGSFTIHFPSNMETKISNLTGYPTFGATSSRITLVYDLTETY